MNAVRRPSIAVIWPFGAADRAGLGQFYAQALTALGHDVLGMAIHEVDPWTTRGLLLRNETRRRSHLQARVRVLRERMRARGVRMVLVIKAEELSAEDVMALRPEPGVTMVLYHPDSPIWILRPYRGPVVEALRAYDVVATFAEVFVPVFRQVGVKQVVRIPFAHHPPVHFPVVLADHERATYASRLSYAGNVGPLQRYWLQRLGRFQPKPFGAGWDHPSKLKKGIRQVRGYQRYVDSLPGFGAKLNKVCAGAEVVLNLVRAETDCAHSMKTFELPAAAACVATNRTAEQLEFFPDGCAYFDTPEEAIDVIDRLLGDPEERARLRDAAVEEARPHTYEARATKLLEIVQP